MIKILYPKPGDVSRMGGKQLMEIQADTEAEIMALRARVDDGVQTFVAAPGSVAHTPDHSADWEFSPAGTWVKRGGGTFIVNATITTMSDDNLTGYVIFDKNFAETLAAVKAGRYVTCRVDVGDDVVHIVPACGYGSDLVEFILAVNGVQLRVRYFEGFEEGSVEITPPAS